VHQHISLLKQIQKLAVGNPAQDSAVGDVPRKIFQSCRAISGDQEFGFRRIDGSPGLQEIVNALSSAGATQKKNSKRARAPATLLGLKILRVDAEMAPDDLLGLDSERLHQKCRKLRMNQNELCLARLVS
jgi:hypothetical protein